MNFSEGEEEEEKDCGLVAVAIDKDRSSQHALKWAIDCLMVKGQTIILVHVRLKKNPCSSSSQSSQRALPYESEQNNNMNDFILPFRCFCTRKDVDCKVLILEDTDVAKALLEYVTQSAIRNLVVGSPKKNGFLRFKTPIEDITGNVSRGAPDFCNVYGITKGKILCTHAATSPIPSRKQILNNIVKVDPPHTNHNITLSTKEPQKKPMESPVHFEAGPIISPFTRERVANGKTKMCGDSKMPEIDIFYVSSNGGGIPNTNTNQNNFPSYYKDTIEKIGTPSMLPKYSNATDMSSFEPLKFEHQFMDINSPRYTKTTSTSLSSIQVDENPIHEETDEAHGKEVEKVKVNRQSRKDREFNYLTSLRVVKLLEDIKREGRIMNQRQIDMFERSYLQKQERLVLEQSKLEMERSVEDERIMSLNTNGMPPLQAEYIHCRQMKIVNKRM